MQFFSSPYSNFAKIISPITSMLMKNLHFIWNNEHQHVFTDIKSKLTSNPILHLYDAMAYTEVYTDASADGIPGMLLQAASEK